MRICPNNVLVQYEITLKYDVCLDRIMKGNYEKIIICSLNHFIYIKLACESALVMLIIKGFVIKSFC